MKHVWVKRLSDGQVLDIPESALQETLKRGFELVKQEQKIETQEVKFGCPLCPFVGKTEGGLRLHKRRHK